MLDSQRKVILSALALSILLLSLPTYTQERKEPSELTGRAVLLQLGILFSADKVLGHKPEETLWVAEQLVTLNGLQDQYYELRQKAIGKPDSLLDVISKDNAAFYDLRESICKQRPNLQVVDLDGKLKPCKN